MKRTLSAILILTLIVSLLSCGEKDRDYDEYDVKIAAETLIKKSRSLNEVYWGRGIGYYEDDNYADGYYLPADPVSLYELGFETLDQLKEKTGEVFSKKYCEAIFDSTFVSDADAGTFVTKRYYQGIDCIMVYSKANVFLTDKVTYLYDTITVTGSSGETVFVKIKVKVERGELSQERDIEIGLVEEEAGWRIDTPTYASYRQE